MKDLRKLKDQLDKEVVGYDYVFAVGQTAARLALDTSNININKMRGRDFEYKTGVAKRGKS
jgi:hypothetical protein